MKTNNYIIDFLIDTYNADDIDNTDIKNIIIEHETSLLKFKEKLNNETFKKIESIIRLKEYSKFEEYSKSERRKFFDKFVEQLDKYEKQSNSIKTEYPPCQHGSNMGASCLNNNSEPDTATLNETLRDTTYLKKQIEELKNKYINSEFKDFANKIYDTQSKYPELIEEIIEGREELKKAGEPYQNVKYYLTNLKSEKPEFVEFANKIYDLQKEWLEKIDFEKTTDADKKKIYDYFKNIPISFFKGIDLVPNKSVFENENDPLYIPISEIKDATTPINKSDMVYIYDKNIRPQIIPDYNPFEDSNHPLYQQLNPKPFEFYSSDNPVHGGTDNLDPKIKPFLQNKETALSLSVNDLKRTVNMEREIPIGDYNTSIYDASLKTKTLSQEQINYVKPF